MAGATHIPNEVANQVIFAGVETIPGVAVAATHRWTGMLDASKSAALNRQLETTGGYDRFLTPRRSPATFAGTYGEALSFETFPALMRHGLRAGSVGVTDGETTPGYTYDKVPSFNEDLIDTATLRHNVPGLGFISTGVRFNEFTIAIDADAADGAWMLSSSLFMSSFDRLPGAFDGVVTGGAATTLTMTAAGWTVNAWAGAWVFLDFGSHIGEVRQVVSNTADTLTVSTAWASNPTALDIFRIEPLFPAGIAIPQNEVIPSYATRVYLDNATADIGDTLLAGRVISASVTVTNNFTTKRFLDNTANEVSARTGRGERVVSGQLRLEFDRADEYEQWENNDEATIRIEQTGSVIDATATPDPTTKLARIDIPRALWDTVARDTRENNLTATFAFLAYLDESEPIIRTVAKNTLATLP